MKSAERTQAAPMDVRLRRDRERAIALGNFLSKRREQLTPEEVGLPRGPRRRVKGLRREEVAQLANVSPTWYTWLEQGRDIMASVGVLQSVARALRLDEAQTGYLYSLAGMTPAPAQPYVPETVDPTYQHLLDSLDLIPAHIMGRCWDILAWNLASRAIWVDYDAIPPAERNLMWLMFTREDVRRRIARWRLHARFMIAGFRATTASCQDDPRFVQIVNSLTEVSPEFRRWWPNHEVGKRVVTLKQVEIPEMGTLTFEQGGWMSSHYSGLQLVFYTPKEPKDFALVRACIERFLSEQRRAR